MPKIQHKATARCLGVSTQQFISRLTEQWTLQSQVYTPLFLQRNLVMCKCARLAEVLGHVVGR